MNGLRATVTKLWRVCSIHLVHDELKDKQFELELSWVCEESRGVHERVPAALQAEAEKSARAAMEEDSDSDTDGMWTPLYVYYLINYVFNKIFIS